MENIGNFLKIDDLLRFQLKINRRIEFWKSQIKGCVLIDQNFRSLIYFFGHKRFYFDFWNRFQHELYTISRGVKFLKIFYFKISKGDKN